MEREQEREIEWDCTKVLNQFYVLADQGDFEKAANLFTEDSVWNLNGNELHGRAAIEEGLRSGFTPVFIKHYIQNIVVDAIDEDHADAVAYAQVFRHEKSEVTDGTVPSISIVGPWSIGRQDNKMVRTSEGWKVARRDIGSFLRRA